MLLLKLSSTKNRATECSIKRVGRTIYSRHGLHYTRFWPKTHFYFFAQEYYIISICCILIKFPRCNLIIPQIYAILNKSNNLLAIK